MAVYCSKCGTELKENDQFCGKCGAPVLKAGGAQKSGGADAAKYKIIGIAAIAVVVLAVGSFPIQRKSDFVRPAEQSWLRMRSFVRSVGRRFCEA